MKTEMLILTASVLAALPMVVPRTVFGLRPFGFVVAATLSAAFVGGALMLLSERKRRAGIIAGVAAGLESRCVWVRGAAGAVWGCAIPRRLRVRADGEMILSPKLLKQRRIIHV